MSTNRRQFLQQTTLAAAAGITGVTVQSPDQNPLKKNMFVHHVYFWLNNPDSRDDRAKLVEGLTTLTKIKYVQMFHIGQPADTNREVIDRSYAISWLMVFKDRADQDAYQVDPVHLDFVKNYSHLWKKVVVYDSVDV
ncbi:MAG TPA: Dabb family protein [Chitinophagaceae bacterium]|jgi:hypothetical protein|nr:Dabb family protein [Chitinophagaceae bacterium]